MGDSITSLPSNLASLQWARQLQLEHTQLVMFIIIEGKAQCHACRNEVEHYLVVQQGARQAVHVLL